MSFDFCENFLPHPAAYDFARCLIRLLPEAGPSVAATLTPAVRYIATAAVDEALKVGASKYGGVPDLPIDSEWPFWTDAAGNRHELRFHAQIDLAEAVAVAPAPLDLPNDGLLSFFVDLNDEMEGSKGTYPWEQPGSSTVLYTPPKTTLQRTESPVPVLPVGRFSSVGCWTWRDMRVDLPDDESDRLDEFSNEYETFLRGSVVTDDMHGGRHQLGGHEWFVQDPVAEDVVKTLASCYDEPDPCDPARCEWVANQVNNWRLLLQIDSDEKIGAMWNDVGTIYWMVRNEDIAAGRWDNGMFDIQC